MACSKLSLACRLSCSNSFSLDGPVNSEAAGLEITFLCKEEKNDCVMFEADLGTQLAGAFMLFKTTFYIIQNNGDIDITIRC